MASVTIKAAFRQDVDTVWKVVTSLENFQWRSDLSRIEVTSGTQFVEYTKDGYATTFTITAAEPPIRWEFNLENGNMTGHWTGRFFAREDGRTEIEFTEDVEAKKAVLKPFVRLFLKKQQKRYVADLRKALEGCRVAGESATE